MENKVVLHVMGMDSSKYGGIERFNVQLAKLLSEKGYKSVFVYETEPVSTAYVEDLEAANGVIVVMNSREHPLRFCHDFAKLLSKYRPVVVHAHFTKARFYAIPVAFAKGVRKLFFTVHSMMLPKSQIKPHTRLWFRFANKVSKVIAVSNNICSVYQSNWPKAKVERIYLGVDSISGDRVESRAKLGILEGQKMLLTVANFNQIKGLDVLCKAVFILRNKGVMNDACLYIVGQPDADMNELGKLIEKLGVGEDIRMVGITNNVPDYLLSADVYIQASRKEGIGLALMEAASAALPLIGTKVGGIPEVVQDGKNGILVEPDNAEMLAGAIERLLQNVELRQQFGRNSLNVYEKSFSLENGVKQTFEYYGL